MTTNPQLHKKINQSRYAGRLIKPLNWATSVIKIIECY